jgi:hypothetical protein
MMQRFISTHFGIANRVALSQSRCWLALCIFSLLIAALTTGCLDTRPLGRADLSEPGWRLREGQAVWKMKKSAPELAGEILLATRADGRAYLQFTKTPFPFVIAQLTTNSWQFELPTQNRRYSGPGKGPARLPWLRLPGLLQGEAPAKGWQWTTPEANHWRLERLSSGEFIEGFLEP